MVVGRVKINGGEDADIVVNSSNHTQIVPHGHGPVDEKTPAGPGVYNDSFGPGQPGGPSGPGVVGYGNAAPPSYGSGIGEPLGGQGLQGQNLPGDKYPAEKYR